MAGAWSRAKAGANRQTAEFRAPAKRADGEQYCLQRERIGRRQRNEGAHIVPEGHCYQI